MNWWPWIPFRNVRRLQRAHRPSTPVRGIELKRERATPTWFAKSWRLTALLCARRPLHSPWLLERELEDDFYGARWWWRTPPRWRWR